MVHKAHDGNAPNRSLSPLLVGLSHRQFPKKSIFFSEVPSADPEKGSQGGACVVKLRADRHRPPVTVPSASFSERLFLFWSKILLHKTFLAFLAVGTPHCLSALFSPPRLLLPTFSLHGKAGSYSREQGHWSLLCTDGERSSLSFSFARN